MAATKEQKAARELPVTSLSEDMMQLIRWKLRRFGERSSFEDGLQEGYIQAWRDIEKGGYDFYHILHRAQTKAHAFFMEDGHHHPTGHLAITSENRRLPETAQAIRDKIVAYREEYFRLHDQYPPHTVADKALGLKEGSVGNHVRSMAKYGSYKPQMTEDGRVDVRAYQLVSLDWQPDEASDTNDIVAMARYQVLQTPSFEDEYVDQVSFFDLIKPLPVDMKQILTMKFIYEMKESEIGRVLGYKHAQVGANRKIKKALKMLKSIIENSHDVR